jgi:hypothetical protein
VEKRSRNEGAGVRKHAPVVDAAGGQKMGFHVVRIGHDATMAGASHSLKRLGDVRFGGVVKPWLVIPRGQPWPPRRRLPAREGFAAPCLHLVLRASSRMCGPPNAWQFCRLQRMRKRIKKGDKDNNNVNIEYTNGIKAHILFV